MTATVPEIPTPRVTAPRPPTAEHTAQHPDGVGLLADLRRARDIAHARELLGTADLVRHRLRTSHPDLDALAGRPLVTGRPYNAVRGAVELTARDLAEACATDPRTAAAQVWAAWTAGTDHRTLWHAAAQGRITQAQAHTIANQAARLHDRTLAITGTGDGTEISPGEPLLTRDELPHALEEFFTQAIEWAEHDDVHGPTLRGRCFRLIDRMTPGWTAIKKTTRLPGRQIVLNPCEDGETAHLTLDVPLGLGRRLQCFANAAADRTARAATTAGLHDPRDHATRANDVLVDVLHHGLTLNTPARSDSLLSPADDQHPTPTARTHEPATSVLVLVRIDATTLFGTDTHDTAEVAWVDGLGPVSPETARELATSTGATWRKVITAPGTRAVLDVAATAYEPSDRLRRFITARDQFCRAPGGHVPAADCDIDHIVPWPQGATEVDNLQARAAPTTATRPSSAGRTPATTADDSPPTATPSTPTTTHHRSESRSRFHDVARALLLRPPRRLKLAPADAEQRPCLPRRP